jgi:hypothetical protein
MHLGMSAERAARLHKPNKARVVGGLLNEFGNMPWAHVDDLFPFFKEKYRRQSYEKSAWCFLISNHETGNRETRFAGVRSA